jgi:hypothetical protein
MREGGEAPREADEDEGIVRDDGDDWRGGGYFVWDADCGTVTLCRRLVFLDPNGPTGVS